jgi:hypothetical protein
MATASVAVQRSLKKSAIMPTIIPDVIVEYVAMRPSPIDDMSETVVPFAPVRAKTFSNNPDPLDQAGQSIIGLLQRAEVPE